MIKFVLVTLAFLYSSYTFYFYFTLEKHSAAKDILLIFFGIVAVLLFFVLKSMWPKWEGTLIEIKNHTFSNTSSGRKDIGIAVIRRTDGKVMKEVIKPGWKVGDKFIKRRGSMSFKHEPLNN